MFLFIYCTQSDNSSKCLKSFWASWQVSYTLKWEVGRRPDCLIVTWESEEVDKPKSLWGSKEHNFFLRQQEKTMGQILILCNFIGFHCFFHVLPEGEMYCYLWESFHKRVTEDENIASGRLMNDMAFSLVWNFQINILGTLYLKDLCIKVRKF